MLNFLYVLLMTFTFCTSLADSNLPKINPGDPLPSDLFIKIAKKLNPTVVNISTETRIQSRGIPKGLQNDPFFEFFKPFMIPNQQQPRQSLGTGFIIRKDGLILTNAHVVDKADIIKVQLSEKDKTLYEAEVIGKDIRTDTALIKIKSKQPLPVAELGTSEDVQVGEWVAAIGNPFGHGHSVTKGIISAKGREINELNRFPFLQTDASINPGNSGGPLVNSQGQVIGVNTAIDARAQGIGFAIPIDNVKKLLPILEKKGFIERGYLGVLMADINMESAQALKLKDQNGALITQIIENSPADKAGMKPYDVVTQVDSKKVDTTSDLARIISDIAVGEKVKLTIIRQGKEKSVNVKIEKHPDDLQIAQQKTFSTKSGIKDSHNLGFSFKSMTLSERKSLKLKTFQPIIVEVAPYSPAARSGIQPGDIILDVNTKPVKTPSDINRYLSGKRTNILRLLRNDRVFLAYIRPN